MTSFTSTPLTSNWTFKQGDRKSQHICLSTNDLPTEIFRDLLKHDKIKDPFQDLNEQSVKWVGDETWTYKTTFSTPVNHGEAGVTTVLNFEGLDTFATVYLNNMEILRSENMFVQHRVDVTKLLHQKDDNVLEIVFESARLRGLELVKQYPEHRFIVHQTEISRGPVRKAQYQWGWDWGPILLSCGPWRPITIETYASKIDDLLVDYETGEDMKSATVKLAARCLDFVESVRFSITNKNTGKTLAEAIVKVGAKTNSETVDSTHVLDDIELWWPRGYGNQELYTIQAELLFGKDDSRSIHTASKTIGFRKVELVQEPDEDGTSFYFRVNNVDIFIGGSCWIPADSFLTRPTPADYRSWVELAAAGNQNMLRVWGGGIYEDDVLFDTADELGILVWQDFAFACASYPTYSIYLASVETEAIQNVRRLRHHPSLIIWAGNNEDYQIPERYNIPYDRDEKDPEKWLKSGFPARYIYEYLLPKIIKQESSHTAYHPSSPFGNGKSTVLKVDPTIGDIHQWNVWHGTMEPYQRFPDLGGRFVSEFGMEAYPSISTLEKYITCEQDRQPGSMVMDARNKAIGHERRLVSYVAENFRLRYDTEEFTHLTQIMQADAMSWAYKSWRRQWGTQGKRKCGGVLVWQLNDCWPTVSWAVVDYLRVAKPAFYAIKRAMEPLTIAVQREFRPWTMRPANETWQRDTGHVDMHSQWTNANFDVWVANNTLNQVNDVFVEMRAWSIDTGDLIYEQRTGPTTIIANGTTTIYANHMFIEDETGMWDPYVLEVRLLINNECVATDTAWPEPIKYLSLKNGMVEFCYEDDGRKVYMSVKKPVKGFAFIHDESITLSDNGFDIMPGQEKEVLISGGTAEELKCTYVGL